MTEEAPEIEAKLIEFGNTAKAIPYYAVFRPGKAPHHFEGNFAAVGAKGFLEKAGIDANTEVVEEAGSVSLDYKPFSAEALQTHVADGRTVLVTFHADWNLVSKFNDRVALNTEMTRSAIESRNVVVLKADMTDENQVAEAALDELGNTARSIPYYAIYRPDEKPDHFGGNFTSTGAEAFLQRAGFGGSVENAKLDQGHEYDIELIQFDKPPAGTTVPAG